MLAAQRIEVRADQLDYNLLDLSFALQNVVVRAPERPEAPPFVVLRSVKVDLGLMDVIRGRYVIESGEVDGLDLHYLVEEDGRDNVPRPPSDPDAPSEPLDYLIAKLDITNATLRYENRAEKLDVVLPVRTVSVNGDAATSRHEVTLRAADGTVHAQGRDLRLDSLNGELNLGTDDVRIDRLVLDAEGSRAELSGTLEQFADPKVDGALKADLDVARAVELAGIDEPAGGRIVIDGTAVGPVAALAVNARIAGRDLKFRQLENMTLDARAAYDMARGIATAQQLDVRAPWGTVAGKGQVALEGGDSNVSLQASGIDVATIMRSLEMSQVAATRVDAQVQASWSGLEYTAATGDADISLTPTQSRASRSALPVGGRLVVKADSGQAVAQLSALEAAGARLDGRVSLTDQSKLGGTVRAVVGDVATTTAQVERFLGQPAGSLVPVRIAGRVVADSTLGGTVSNPTAAVALDAPSLTAGGTGDIALNANAKYTTDVLILDGLNLTWADATAHAEGRVGLTGRQALALTFNVDSLEVPSLLVLAGQPDVPAAGTLSLTGQARGTISAPVADVDVTGSNLAAYNEPLGELRATAQMRGRDVILDELVLDKPQPDGNGRLTASGRYGLDAGTYAFTLESDNIELTSLTLPDGRPLRGVVNLDGRGDGTTANPSATIAMALERLQLAEHELGRVAVDASLANERADIELSADRFGVQANATVATTTGYPSTLQARITDLDLAALPVTLETPLTGSVSATVDATGNLTEPRAARVDATIQTFQGEWHGQPFGLEGPAVLGLADERITIAALTLAARDSKVSVTGMLPLDATGGEGAVNIDARANLATLAEYAPVGTELSAEGTLQLTGTVTGNLTRLDPTLELQLDNGVVLSPQIEPGLTGVTIRARVADGVAAIEQLAAKWGTATIDATARVPFGLLPELPVEIPRADGNATARASVVGLDPAMVPGAPEGVSGLVSVNAVATADRADLAAVTGAVTFPDLQLAFKGLDIAQQQPSVLRIADGVVTIEQFALDGSAGTLGAKGTLGLIDARPLDVVAQGNVNTAALGVFTDAVQAEGQATLNLAAKGTLDSPDLSGTLALSGVTLAVDEPAIAAENLNARVELAGDRITLSNLSADLNGGTLTGSGGLAFGSEGIRDVNLTLDANDVAFSAPLDLRSLSSATLTVTDRGDDIVLGGKITIKEAGLTGDIKFDQGILATLTAPRALDLTEERDPTLERLKFNVQVVTASPIILDNNLARAEVTTDLRILGTIYETGLSGRMSVLEGGEIMLNERRYAVERGTITFLDERRIVPSFDLRLSTTASKYDVVLAVTGEPGDTDTSLTSDPVLPEPDIMALLVTGRTLDEMRGEEYDVAKEQVLSYLGGRVGSRLGRKIEGATGLSDVRIEPSLIANETNPGARLTVGQDLTDRLKLIYSTDLADNSDQIWVARYDVTRRFRTNAVSQGDGSYRFDFQHDVRKGGRPAPGRLVRTRPTVASLNVVGADVLPEARLRKLLGLEAGKSFDFFDARDGVTKIEKALQEQGHLQARVRLEREVQGDALALTLRVRSGPVVQLQYLGETPPSKVDKAVRRQWNRGVFDAQRGADAAETLRNWLISEEYLSATVEYAIEDTGADARRVVLTINPGTRYDRIELVFSGASGIDPEVLDDIVDEQKLELALFTDPIVVTTLLQRYYREEGYLVAEIDTPRYEYEGNIARAVLDVREGPRFTVGKVTVEGNTAFTTPMLLSELPVVPGDPFLPRAAENAYDRIRDLYWRRAYNDVHSEYVLALNRETGLVDVRFAIREGARSVVADVTIAGNDRTSDRLVREQVELNDKEPLDLAVLSRSRRNLYDTGAFSIVDITREVEGEPTISPLADASTTPGVPPAAGELAPPTVPGPAASASGATSASAATAAPASSPAAPDPDGTRDAAAAAVTAPTAGEAVAAAATADEKQVHVTVAVREVQPIQVRYGASFDTERGPGGIVDISNRNSIGKARVLGLSTRYAARLKEARLYASQPSLRYAPTQTSASLYYREERNLESALADAFDVDRFGASIQRERTLRNAYVWSYGYRYERARKFSPLLGGSSAETIAVAPLTSSFTRETRDDILDATTGSFTSHAFSYSPAWLGADADYLKYFGQYFRYFQLREPTRKRFTNEIIRPRLVYAVGARVGIARGLGGSVPETERFYAGGSTTLRGFEQNAVGPIGADRIPTGGDALLVINNELRFPLVSIFDGVGFFDVGNVFNSFSDVSFGDIRETVGVGLRVRTPWLLVRGDYGIVLNPRPGESRSRVYFSIGQAF